jgi:small subunit ribosomal protein S9
MTESKAKTVKKTDGETRRYIEMMGKRKTAAARVRMYEGGTGKIIVNDVTISEYFPAPIAQTIILEPLKLTSLDEKLDYTIRVSGGGKQGQAEAVRHGIACTLLALNKELRPLLKAQGWLTRDARKKERKKPGLKKARRAPQWSKR